MSGNTFAHTPTRGIRLLVMAALLAGWATSAVQAGPTYQPPTNNVYVIHAGAYVDINTPIGASPGAADDADSGAANCTLRDALGIVNAGTTAGTVNGCTITTVGAPAGNIYRINLPTGGYAYTLNGSELLTTANTVYIVGDTAANAIIQASSVDPTQPLPPPGAADYRVLRNNGATVEISNVTIRHGQCAGACAGINASGGGIYNQAGTTTVDASTVSANTAIDGGGIYNEGTLNVQNGSIIGGAGAGNMAIWGSGIWNWAGTVTVDASTVSANRAVNNGGGIANFATLNVRNGSIIGGASAGNQTNNNGGGIWNAAGTTTVDASTVSANTAIDGGGIYSNGTLNVRNGSIIGGTGAGNMANDRGGGIYNNSGTTTVDASTVSANRAINNGGGIWNSAALNVVNGSIIGGAGAGNQALNGGGIYNRAGTTTVTGSRILYNTATTDGSGLYNDCDMAGATSVTDSCIVGNSATSFLNNQPAQQTATGNWWGAATGPNSPCADTVGGNVDTSGFLTAPILGCPANCPDLRVNKANDTGGNGRVGTPFNWTLTISNTDAAGATFTAGQRILGDDLPAGPIYGAPAAGNFTNVTNSGNINCAIVGNTLTCDAQGGDVTIGATTGRFDVVIPVTPNAVGLLSNPAGNCRVDPNNDVAESNEGNNDCADSVNVAPAPRPPEKEGPPPPPTAIPAPQVREFNCWPWLVVVPPGAAPNAAPGEWCQASLGQPLPAASTFRYLGHSTEVTVKDAAGAAITQFAQPIKVCFHYTQPELDAVGGDPADFLFQVWRDGKWDALDAKPDGSLRYPGVCAPVDHLTLFALFARTGTAAEASAAAASDSTLVFPTHLPETGAPPGGWPLVVVGLWLVLAGYATHRSLTKLD